MICFIADFCPPVGAEAYYGFGRIMGVAVHVFNRDSVCVVFHLISRYDEIEFFNY